MFTATQRGTAGEQLFAACVTLSSRGELELFKPLRRSGPPPAWNAPTPPPQRLIA